MTLEKAYSQKVHLAHRKKFAQFFTPEPIAQLMVNWLLKSDKVSSLLEPAFGLGVFSRLFLNSQKEIQITGFDIDPVIFEIAKQNFNDFSNVHLLLEDYLFNDWGSKYDAIVCNPPYFKFHDYQNKKALEKVKNKLKINLSGFTNIYTLFLLKSVYQLNEQGRIAYIVPYEFFNSDYGTYIKEYLLASNTLRHIILFDFKQNIFDDALTTSAIILLAKDDNDKQVCFSVMSSIKQLDEISAIINAYPDTAGKNVIDKNVLNPNIKWRTYYQKQRSREYNNLIPFKNMAKVVRGIATGANDYFAFNSKKAEKYSIREKFLLPCITKSKDADKPFFTPEYFERLKKENANIYLFNAGKKVTDENVLHYIDIGLQARIHKKYLTSKRTPWYLLENRPPAPIWAGVFNRGEIKFIRNEAGISNLTAFHCIYPVSSLFSSVETDLLFAYLLTDTAKQIFNDNRREYGDGLKKFEPNDLNNALMLDLSMLNNQTKKSILNLYAQYRKSVIHHLEKTEFIESINEILKKIYRK